MDEELDVIVTGFDVAERQAEAGLMTVFGLDASRARRFVRGLPTVAKRCGNRASADRYVRALHSIGACVEVKVASDEAAGPEPGPGLRVSSLPIPAPSVMAQLNETARVERETVRAIKRFRAAEGLDPGSPLPVDVDPTNPRIPKAPPVPHDLARMPNAKLPRRSDRPDWMLTDPLAQDGGPEKRARSSRPHAEPPPAPNPRQSARPPARTDPPRAGTRESGARSVRPSAVGLAHAATASVRPGLGMLSWWQFNQHREHRWRLRNFWPIAAALVVVATGVLWLSGTFETQASRREHAFRMQGIDPGDHAPAAGWLDAPDHELEGVDKQVARELLVRLDRAGARLVYAVGIHASGNGKRARSLVIELPQHAAQRRTILWQIARARGQRTLEPDHGGRYHVVTFD